MGNHLLLSVTFPKLDISFTKQHEDMLDGLFVQAITDMRPILFKHHVTEVGLCDLEVNLKRLDSPEMSWTYKCAAMNITSHNRVRLKDVKKTTVIFCSENVVVLVVDNLLRKTFEADVERLMLLSIELIDGNS